MLTCPTVRVLLMHMLLAAAIVVGQPCTYTSYTFTTNLLSLGSGCTDLLVTQSTIAGLSLRAQLPLLSTTNGAITVTILSNQFSYNFAATSLTILGWTTTTPSSTLTVTVVLDSNLVSDAGTFYLSGNFPPSTTISIVNNVMTNLYLTASARIANLYFSGITMSGSGSSFVVNNNVLSVRDATSPSVNTMINMLSQQIILSASAQFVVSHNTFISQGTDQAAYGIYFAPAVGAASIDASGGASIKFQSNSFISNATGSKVVYGVSFLRPIAVNGMSATTGAATSVSIADNTFRITAGISAAYGIAVSATATGSYTPGLVVSGGGQLFISGNTFSITSATDAQTVSGVYFSGDSINVAFRSKFVFSGNVYSIVAVGIGRGLSFVTDVVVRQQSVLSITGETFSSSASGALATQEASGICFRTATLTVLGSSAFVASNLVMTITASGYAQTFGFNFNTAPVTVKGHSLFLINGSHMEMNTASSLTTSSQIGINFGSSPLAISQSSMVSIEANSITCTGVHPYPVAFRLSATQLTVISHSQLNIMQNVFSTPITVTRGVLFSSANLTLSDYSYFTHSRNTVLESTSRFLQATAGTFSIDATSQFAVGCDVFVSTTIMTYSSTYFQGVSGDVTITSKSCPLTCDSNLMAMKSNTFGVSYDSSSGLCSADCYEGSPFSYSSLLCAPPHYSTASHSDSASPSFSDSKSSEASNSRTWSSSPTQSETLSDSSSVSPSESQTSTATASQSVTPSPSGSSSLTKSTTVTPTTTPSASESTTASASVTASPSSSGSNSASRSLSPSQTETATLSRSLSSSSTLTLSPTQTSTISTTPSSSRTQTVTLSRSGSLTRSVSPSHSSSTTVTPTSTSSITLSPSRTLTESATVSASSSRSLTPSPSDSVTSSASLTASKSLSVTASETGSKSATSSTTITASPSSSGSMSSTQTLSLSRTATLTRTTSLSLSRSHSPSTSSSQSLTHSNSMTMTPSSTRTATSSPTASLSRSLSVSQTPTESRSVSLSMSLSKTTTRTPSASPTTTSSVSVSRTRTLSRTASATVTTTATSSVTASRSATVTASLTISRSTSSSNSITTSSSPSVSVSLSRSVSLSETTTATPSKSLTTSASPTPSSSDTQSVTQSATLSKSSSVTLSLSITPSRSLSHSVSQSPSETNSASVTTSASVTSSVSMSPSKSLSATLTPTQSESQSVSISRSLSHSLTLTPSRSASSSPTASLSVSATSTVTTSSTLTRTSSVTSSPTASQSVTSSPTRTQTSSLSASLSLTSSVSPTQSKSTTSSLSPTTSKSVSSSSTITPSPSDSVSVTKSSTATVTQSPTTTSSLSLSQSTTQSRSVSVSRSASQTMSLSRSASATATATITTSVSRSGTLSFSTTPSPSVSETPSHTGSVTQSLTPSPTSSKSISSSASLSLSRSGSLSPSSSASLSLSQSRTLSLTASNSVTSSSTVTLSRSTSKSLSQTRSQSATETASLSLSLSVTNSPSSSKSVSASMTMSPSVTNSSTPSSSESVTGSSTPSTSESMSKSMSASVTSSLSLSRSVSATATLSPSQTSSQSVTVSKTTSMSLSPTASTSVSLSRSISMSTSDSLSGSGSASLTNSSSPSDSASVTESATQSSSVTSSPSTTSSLSLSLSRSVSMSVTPSRTGSQSISLSPSPTESQSQTSTNSLSRSESVSASRSVSVSDSKSLSLSQSASLSASPSPSLSSSVTRSRSASVTASLTPSRTSSVSLSASRSVTASATPSKSQSLTESTTPSRSASLSTSASESASTSNSRSVTDSITPSRSSSISVTESPSASTTVTMSRSATATMTTTTTQSTTLSISRSPSQSSSKSLTASRSNSLTDSPTLSRSSSATDSISPSSTETATLSRSLSSSVSMSRSISTTPSATESVTPSRTNSISSSDSRSATESVTASVTSSHSYSSTPTSSLSVSPSGSESPTISDSLSRSVSNSLSVSRSVSSSVTLSTSRSLTPSTTSSLSLTQSPSITDSLSRSVSLSLSVTASASVTDSPSASNSDTPSQSNSVSRSTSLTQSGTVTPTKTSSLSLTQSPSITDSLSRSVSLSLSVTASASVTDSPSVSNSDTPSQSNSVSRSTSLTQSGTVTPTKTSSLSLTQSPSNSESASASNTDSPSSTVSQSITASTTLSRSITPSLTRSLTVTSSPSTTDSLSVTRSASASNSLTRSLSVSSSLSASSSLTSSSSPSSTRSNSPSSSDTPSKTASQSLTSSLTVSQSMSASQSRSASLTASRSVTDSASMSKSASSSVTESPSHTSSLSPSDTLSRSVTSSQSSSNSDSGSSSVSSSLSESTSASPSDSPSGTTTTSVSFSNSITDTITPPPTPTPTFSMSLEESLTRSSTDSRSSSTSLSGSVSATQSTTDTASQSETQSESFSSSLTSTSSGSQSTSGTSSFSSSLSLTSSMSGTASGTTSASTSYSTSASLSGSQSQSVSTSMSTSMSGTLSQSSSASTTSTFSTSASTSQTASQSLTTTASTSTSATMTSSMSSSMSFSISDVVSSSVSRSSTFTPTLTESWMCIWFYQHTTADLPKNISFIPPVEPGYAVTGVSGCDDTFPSTGNCPQNGIKPLYIFGRDLNFGVNVSFVFQNGTDDNPVEYLVSCKKHVYVDPTVIMCLEYSGQGTDGYAILTSPANTEFVFTMNPNVTLSFQPTVKPDCGANDTCSGHGRCDPYLGCQCVATSQLGYWNGTYCDRCQSLYYGESCQRSCTGSCACVNGICSEGTNGTGCVCQSDKFLGFWAGVTCDYCQGNYYGPDCKKACPSRVDEYQACGLGVCSEGIMGTGLCSCNLGALLDVNGSCTLCDAGFYGPSCQLCGRPEASISPCYGHGVCSEGIRGNGECTCAIGYVGTMCERYCTPSNNASGILAACGHGTCIAAGRCACDGNWSISATGSCDTCLDGYWGPECQYQCPSCVHGKCSQGPTGTGLCVCQLGYFDRLCSGTCPGLVNGKPCYGHGSCDLLNGSCTCYSNSSHGFWKGAFCNLCQSSYLSDNCTLACPRANNVICNGRGVCYNGVCKNCIPVFPDKHTVVCGNACSLFDFDCAPKSNCQAGHYGASCAGICPGAIGNSSNACSAKGFCDPLSGVCTCNFGTGGSACELQCPEGISSLGLVYPCSGVGDCNANGTCSCQYGYYGPACQTECPGGANNVCNGNGVCNSLGGCTCYLGYFGPTCAGICPGGVSNPCSRRGDCSELGLCACYANTSGYFSGSQCDQCRSGYAGSSCLEFCDATRASSVDKRCVCNPGFAGSNCTIACPVVGGATCAGHGSCNEGSTGDGKCTCVPGFFGYNCSTECNPTYCLNNYGMINSECSTDGLCRCRTNGSKFAGNDCRACADGYWGVMCNLPCDCNSHGSCEQYSGSCSCYGDDDRGYWRGSKCDVCRDGFIGRKCVQRNMQISASSNTSFAVKTSEPTAPGNLYFDEARNTFISGSSQPLVIFNNTVPMTSLGSVDVGGNIMAFYPDGDNIVVWTKTPDQYVQKKLVSYKNFSNVTVLQNKSIPVTTQSSRRLMAEEAIVSESTLQGLKAKVAFHAQSSSILNFKSFRVTIQFLETLSTFTFNVSLYAVSWVQYDRNGTYITLAGQDNSSLWCVTIFKVTNSVPAIIQEYSGSSFNATACGSTNCASAAMCFIASTEQLICVLRKPSTGPVFLTTPLLAPAGTQMSSVLVSDMQTSVFNVTAFAEDSYFNVMIFAFNGDGESSMLAQVNNTDSPVVLTVMPPSSSAIRIISAFLINTITRSLYAMYQADYFVYLTLINLFGVNQVTPNVLDVAGSTPVVIKGYGFGPLYPLSCDFGQGVLSNATVLDNFTVSCNATTSTADGSACKTVYFNLVSNARTTAATNTPLNRVAGATLLSVSNSAGYPGYIGVGKASIITVAGFGFISSSYAKCRLVDGNGSLITSLDPVSFKTGNLVTCTQPPIFTMTKFPTYIEFSQDGTVYGTSKVTYSVVGESFNLIGELTGNSTGVVVADESTTLPSVRAYLVDALGNARGALETSTVSFRASTVPYSVFGNIEELVFSNTSVNVVQMKEGAVVFDNMTVLLPVAGTYTIYMRSLTANPLQTSVTFVIVPGAPYRVTLGNISRSVAAWFVPVRTKSLLQPSPVAVIVDKANNIIQDTTVLPTQVLLQYLNAAQNASNGDVYYQQMELVAVPDASGAYQFGGVSVQTVYESHFSLTLKAAQTDVVGKLGSYMSPWLTVEKCVAGTEYSVPGTFTCRPCPPHAFCDGSSTIQAMPGYWRSTVESLTMYSCAPPYGSDSCSLSLASCNDGYQGPRCSSCLDGYGKSGNRCVECMSKAVNWVITWVVFLAIIVLTSILVIRSINDSAYAARAENTVAVVKSLLSHAQVLGALSVLLTEGEMPSFFANFFDAGSQTYIQVNFSFLSCILSHTAPDSFVLSVAIPWVLLGFVLMIVLGRGASIYYKGYFAYRKKALRILERQKAKAKSSIFHKTSAYTDMPSMFDGGSDDDDQLIKDGVDPQELAMYRMEAFGDDKPSSDEEMEAERAEKAERESNLASYYEASSIQKHMPDDEALQSSMMTRLAEKGRRMSKKKVSFTPSKPLSPAPKRSIRLVGPSPVRMTPPPTRMPEDDDATPASTVHSATPAAKIRNPLVPPTQRAVALPYIPEFGDGGSTEVSAEAQDPEGFGMPIGPANIATPKTADDSEDTHERAKRQSRLSLGRKAPSFEIPHQGDPDKPDASFAAISASREKTLNDIARRILKKQKEVDAEAQPARVGRGLSRRLARKASSMRMEASISMKSLEASFSSVATTTKSMPTNIDGTPYWNPSFGFEMKAFPHIELSIRQQVIHTAAVTLTVVLFLMHPTVIKACLTMFPCESIDYGRVTHSVLVAERTVDCRAPWFQGYRVAAGIFLALYGIGIPALSVGLVGLLSRLSLEGSMEAARSVFFFVTGGYRTKVWYWESVTMVRKAVILIVLTLIGEQTERRYVTSVIMSLFFVMHRLAKPFEQEVLHLVESVSLLDIAITTNLFMLFPYFPYSSNPVIYIVIVAVIFAVNLVSLCVYGYALFMSSFALLTQTRLYAWWSAPSAIEAYRRHNQLVTGLDTTRLQCRAIHARTYMMDEFLFDALELAVVANKKLEKISKEVGDHNRRLMRRARRQGQDDVVVADVVTAMLAPTANAHETKLRDVLDGTMNAIVYLGAVRAFVATQVTQAYSSADELFMEKVVACVDELYVSEKNVLKSTKRLRKALRRLGGTGGELRDEADTSSSSEESEEAEMSPEQEDRDREMEEQRMYDEYEAQRQALNATLKGTFNAAYEDSAEGSDNNSMRMVDLDDDYFKMLEGEHHHSSASAPRHNDESNHTTPGASALTHSQVRQIPDRSADFDYFNMIGGSQYPPHHIERTPDHEEQGAFATHYGYASPPTAESDTVENNRQ